MCNQRIYLDTSILSAINDPRESEKIHETKEFFKKTKKECLCISTLVLTEANEISNLKRREEIFDITNGLEVFEITDEVIKCSDFYIKHGLIPKTHVEAALHLACATVNNIKILASWNYKHIVKLKTRQLVNALNILQGYNNIEIISPIEF